MYNLIEIAIMVGKFAYIRYSLKLFTYLSYNLYFINKLTSCC